MNALSPREFVVRGRGQFNDIFHFGDQNALLGDYAWFNKNAGEKAHPVGEKKPLVINDHKFYDMNRNVWEWTLETQKSARDDKNNYGFIVGGS